MNVSIQIKYEGEVPIEGIIIVAGNKPPIKRGKNGSSLSHE